MNASVKEEQVRESLKYINKSELADFAHIENFSKLKKDEIQELLLRELLGNEVQFKNFCRKFASDIGISSYMVEEILDCTKTERLRWTQENKLPVVAYSSFRKYGKDLEAPLYDRFFISSLAMDTIENWRTEHKEKVAANRKTAAKKAKETKIKNESAVESFKEEYKRLLISWNKIDMKLAATYELAFWTVWVSRWAKQNQLKAINAHSKADEYYAQKEYLYNLKNAAIKYLANSPHAKLGFYRPQEADKITHLEFCDFHYEMWCEERKAWGYMSKWDYYDMNRKSVQKCKSGCCVEKTKDYYSLFYLEINDKRINDFSFGFHTPYSIGKDMFPPVNSLSLVEHEEEDGIFRFGRALFDEETIIYKEKFVVKKFEEALQKYKLYLSN